MSKIPLPGSPTMVPVQPSLAGFARYFLRLGALGFGGPVALANTMRRDLVETRQWITEEEFDDGLALSAACPGPLAYQLAIYCGYIRYRIAGALTVAVTFALPPFVLVVAIAAAYRQLAATRALHAAFYGIAPIVVALIVKACANLGQRTLKSDVPAWIMAVAACGITILLQRELTWIFIAAGVIGLARSAIRQPAAAPPAPERSPMILFAGAASSKLFLFFLKTGLMIFGSGLVIVPFLKAYVVDQYHWLGDREFLDAVAIGMISPGPVVITATFVGYLLAGFTGALLATAGIFAPPLLFTIVAAPLLIRYRANPHLKATIRGITVAVVGVLAGTTVLVGKAAITDWLTAAVFALTLIALFAVKKLPEPLLVLGGAIIGLIAYR